MGVGAGQLGDPDAELELAGVTGTNGKTTTAFLPGLHPRGGGRGPA